MHACLSVRMLAICVQMPVEGKTNRQIPGAGVSCRQLGTVLSCRFWEPKSSPLEEQEEPLASEGSLPPHPSLQPQRSKLLMRNVSKRYYLEISEELQTLLNLSMSYFVSPVSPHLYFINYSKEKINKNKKACTFLEEPDSWRARGHFAACQADIDFQAHASKCDRWRAFLAPGSSRAWLALSHGAVEGTETARSSTAHNVSGIVYSGELP